MNVNQKVIYYNALETSKYKSKVEEILNNNSLGQNLLQKTPLDDNSILQYLNWNNKRKTGWNTKLDSVFKISLTEAQTQNKIIFDSYLYSDRLYDFMRIQKNLLGFTKQIDCLILDQQSIFEEDEEAQYLEKYEDYCYGLDEKKPQMDIVYLLKKNEIEKMSYMFVDKNQTVMKDGFFHKLFDKEPAGFDLHLNILGIVLQRGLLKGSGSILLGDLCNQEYIQIYLNELRLQQLEQINNGSRAFNFFKYIQYLISTQLFGCYKCSENLKRLEIELDCMVSLFTDKIDIIRGEIIAKQIFDLFSEKSNKVAYCVLPLRLIPYIIKIMQKLAIEQRIVGTNFYNFNRNEFVTNRYQGDLNNLFIEEKELSKKRALSFGLVGIEPFDNEDKRQQILYNQDFRSIFATPAQIFLKDQNDIDCGAIKMIRKSNEPVKTEEPDIDQNVEKVDLRQHAKLKQEQEN